MADVIIPASKQRPGKQLGGLWVVIQAWPIANLWTIALLGEEGARITGGGPEWEVHERSRRVGMTSYKGRVNWEMSIDLLYDGWATHVVRPQLPAAFTDPPRLPIGHRWSIRPGPGTPVGYPTPSGAVWMEGLIQNLENLSYRRGDTGVPPTVRVYGPVPKARERWVISELEYGDYLTDQYTGQRLRQQVTVKLLEHSFGEDLEKLPRGKAKPK